MSYSGIITDEWVSYSRPLIGIVAAISKAGVANKSYILNDLFVCFSGGGASLILTVYNGAQIMLEQNLESVWSQFIFTNINIKCDTGNTLSITLSAAIVGGYESLLAHGITVE